MLHWECVTPELKGLLYKVASNDKLGLFRLCGGTALALQLGHRISIDADYVSQSAFDKQELLEIIEKEIPFVSDLFQGELGVFLKSGGIKMDFLSWNIAFIRNVADRELRLTDKEEIAAMKLFAITRRGEKKDYYDLAVLLKHYTLAQLLGFYHERHPLNDISLVVRCLMGFSDVEAQPDPNSLINFSWADAKTHIQSSVQEYLSK